MIKKFEIDSLKKNKLVIKEILKKIPKIRIFLFEGELGSGKTTLIKQLAKGLKIKEPIVSPTFILWQKYLFQKNNKKYYFNHIDLYRIKAKDILKLDLRKEIQKKENVFFIEWGEKIKKYLKIKKLNFLEIMIKKVNKKTRIFILK